MLLDVSKSRNIALFSHVRPDGDTLGSMLALRQALISMGKTVCTFCDSPTPQYLSFLTGAETINAVVSGAFDTCISLDCADEMRLGKFKPLFFSAALTANVDHHRTNTLYAKVNIVRESASTCEIIYGILKEMQVVFTQEIAECLYTGISTDTGNFGQSNTTPESHLTAAHLMECGVDVEQLSNRLFKEVRLEKLRLIGDCISGMRLFGDGLISVMSVQKSDLDRRGLTLADTEGIINYALNIKGVAIGVCLTQDEGNKYKVSLRSKNKVDVSAVAGYFGGGGHLQASGCVVTGMLEEVIEKLVRQCRLTLGI